MQPTTDQDLSIQPTTDQDLFIKPTTDQDLSIQPTADQHLHPTNYRSRPNRSYNHFQANLGGLFPLEMAVAP